MSWHHMRSVVALAFALSLCAVGAVGQPKQPEERALLAKETRTARVLLEKGLSVSEVRGKPISARYVLADGRLQLSVYVVQADTLFELIVDPQTGKVKKAETIITD